MPPKNAKFANALWHKRSNKLIPSPSSLQLAPKKVEQVLQHPSHTYYKLLKTLENIIVLFNLLGVKIQIGMAFKSRLR